MKLFKKLKYFIYKLKKDFFSLFFYPNVMIKKVDYDLYWQKKRKGTEISSLSEWEQIRADEIIKIIKPNSTVMDLGCGDGAVLKYLNERAGIKGVGVDISDEILNRAKKIGIEVYKKDIFDFQSLDDLPKVDYILGLEVIEHLPCPEELIETLESKTRKGFIFSFPNTGYYAHRLRLLFGRFPLQWITHPGEHLRFWTVRDARWWVHAINYKLDKIILYKGLPVLNKIWSTMFSQGVIIKIFKK